MKGYTQQEEGRPTLLPLTANARGNGCNLP